MSEDKAKVNDNMRIWDKVSKTDPKYTKKVNQRGGFTAIAAASQIMVATSVFGPIGVGWGYTCGEPMFVGPLIMIPVTIWHSGDRSATFGPIYGCAEISGNRPDSDAPKKAMTDAITKGLSQLGFNADVFLGLFDDNKYVAQIAKEFAISETHEEISADIPESVKMMVEGLAMAFQSGDPVQYWESNFKAIPKEWKKYVEQQKDALKELHRKPNPMEAG